MARADACNQQNRRQQTRHELHALPQKPMMPNLFILVMQDHVSVLAKRVFV
ncbi:hypothetical protein [Tardiphaga sp.]|uniref:hypothetical protein n=1 Tax=Tardiphaga sp. TaxID=1926292 RepID=UPI0037DA5129